MRKINIAIVGVGNCASALLQGIHYYKGKTSDNAIGLMHWEIGGYPPDAIDVVAAFDIDRRKVGLDVHQAIFAPPNCTQVFCKEIPDSGTIVQMGCILDGVSDHMLSYDTHRTFVPSDAPQPDQGKVVRILKEVLPSV